MTAPGPSAAAPPGISRRLTLVLALACGLAVANLYYVQPLLETLARAFHASSGRAGLVVTLTQVGYAAGLLFVVPLGDLLERRRLVLIVLAGTAAALAGAAEAPSLPVLAAFAMLVGLTSVVAQVLVPFAATLADDASRGQVVGTVMSGLLLGVLCARTVSGLVAELAGWRAVYWLACGLMLGLALLLWAELPRYRQPVDLTYPQLLASVASLVRAQPVLRRRQFYGAMTYASFGVFWTSVAFLLAGPPYRYSEGLIGLFGLVGVAGALCASVAGRLVDRGWARQSTGGFLAASLASFAVLAFGGRHLLPLIAGVVLLDLGVQGAQITNQSVVYALVPAARSRLTTAYMTTYFAGGALGSALSALVYDVAGWEGVCGLGAVFPALGLVGWLGEVRGAGRVRGG